jgi:hypothetical protein
MSLVIVDNFFVPKDKLIVDIADSLLEASGANDRERLLACCRETVTALRRPLPTTLERELGELLSSIAEELISFLESKEAKGLSGTQLSLYNELLFHVRAMAKLVTK